MAKEFFWDLADTMSILTYNSLRYYSEERILREDTRDIAMIFIWPLSGVFVGLVSWIISRTFLVHKYVEHFIPISNPMVTNTIVRLRVMEHQGRERNYELKFQKREDTEAFISYFSGYYES